MSEETKPRSSIPGFKLLLMGPPKTGKTFCARTVADTELEGAMIFMEPSMAVVADVPCPKLHYAYLPANNMSWKAFKEMARNVATLDNKSLQGMPKGSAGSGQNTFIELIALLNDYKCNRCGKELGDTTTWGTNRILFLDGLTGLSKLSRSLTIGYKPIPTEVDWGVMQENIDQLLYKMVMDLTCHFVLISHVNYRDDIGPGGEMRIFPWTLGKMIAPKLPSYFDDVAMSEKLGDDFYWTTIKKDADVGGRFLPISKQLKPSIALFLDAWKKKGGIVE